MIGETEEGEWAVLCEEAQKTGIEPAEEVPIRAEAYSLHLKNKSIVVYEALALEYPLIAIVQYGSSSRFEASPPINTKTKQKPRPSDFDGFVFFDEDEVVGQSSERVGVKDEGSMMIARANAVSSIDHDLDTAMRVASGVDIEHDLAVFPLSRNVIYRELYDLKNSPITVAMFLDVIAGGDKLQKYRNFYFDLMDRATRDETLKDKLWVSRIKNGLSINGLDIRGLDFYTTPKDREDESTVPESYREAKERYYLV
ncbi:hypothetical protein KBC31_01425 [Candidatus Saccharibacteria bacterium]|jgi:hypothetical protein|nr:hypothetical protein [Candidatus Saccharibacteria bacterium]